jgi:hypothetical protein
MSASVVTKNFHTSPPVGAPWATSSGVVFPLSTKKFAVAASELAADASVNAVTAMLKAFIRLLTERGVQNQGLNSPTAADDTQQAPPKVAPK